MQNEYEVVSLAQEGNEDAVNYIYEKYKPIIVKKSRNAIVFATHHGIDINDIIQEGYIGLSEAITSFNQDTATSFYTFALLCIDRQIINYLRKVVTGKDKILNNAIKIDESLEKTVSDNLNIESSISSKEYLIDMIDDIRNVLTDFEKEVFDLKLDGYSFEEIAKILNKDMKSIYNTFQRIRIKIKKNIEIDD